MSSRTAPAAMARKTGATARTRTKGTTQRSGVTSKPTPAVKSSTKKASSRTLRTPPPACTFCAISSAALTEALAEYRILREALSRDWMRPEHRDALEWLGSFLDRALLGEDPETDEIR